MVHVNKIKNDQSVCIDNKGGRNRELLAVISVGKLEINAKLFVHRLQLLRQPEEQAEFPGNVVADIAENLEFKLVFFYRGKRLLRQLGGKSNQVGAKFVDFGKVKLQ